MICMKQLEPFDKTCLFFGQTEELLNLLAFTSFLCLRIYFIPQLGKLRPRNQKSPTETTVSWLS